MLNAYFVFGVPIFLLVLYFIFAYIRKKNTIHYLGFILLIISGFMLAFNLQTWQQALLEMDQHSTQHLSDKVGYPIYLIWVPILIASGLVLLNLFRAWRRLQQLRKEKN
ncbi:hypothetical protein ACTNBL_02690 [Enterococcus villorum]|uniref:Uncharacterized protein n=2 Tax=Enterococcus villorum TaxID=112904 RepID=A0A511IYF1_9ENTE|nr:hypothetical protein [Enterococcus villorum]EOH89850.1 hypothetical protein UAO_01094 [Enterococcus villorum ATCC 700913]EOW78082.1 hypothetical protein I591_00937 [Enterococcus villorum ATCC 700913]GEL90797.1 hypothetical protein EVI01_01340 [Enterococcus villorum]